MLVQKMRFVWALLCLTIAVSNGKYYDLSQQQAKYSEALVKIEQSCRGTYSKIMDTLFEFNELRKTVNASICDLIHSHGIKNTNSLVTHVQYCLPDKSKDVPILFVKSIISTIQHLCNMKGESIFELLNECLWNDMQNSKFKSCGNKIENIFGNFNSLRQASPNNYEVCGLARDFTDCNLKRTKLCESTKTKDALTGLSDAWMVPCDAASAVKSLFFNILNSAEK